MDMKELAKHLPEQPRPGMAEWIKKNFWKSELGGSFCVFSRTSITLEDEQIGKIMTAEDWERYEHGIHHAWAAECRCTACGEKFITGWNKNHPNSYYGIKIYYGDDGSNYPGYIPEDAAPSVDIGVYDEGDLITCPFCGSRIKLIHKKSLRHGRTYQLLVTSIEVVNNYTVLVTWIASRRVDGESDTDELAILPREALAIEGRKLYRFKHFKLGGGFSHDLHLPEWTPTNYYNDDLALHSYYDYNSIGRRKIDAATFPDVPDLTGTSGEKTGLYDYITGATLDPIPFAYIKLWKKHPSVENLVKSKWRSVLESAIWRESREKNFQYNSKYAVELAEFDFQERSPHKILGISKSEFRNDYGWSCQEFTAYRHHQFYVNELSIAEYDGYLSTYDPTMLEALDVLSEGYNIPYRRMLNYLSKKGLNRKHDAIFYADYIEMLGTGEHTDIELFPRNLTQAHDRLAQQIESEKKSKLMKEFAELAEKYSKLSWNDGNLCIRIAQSEQELIDEGKTLHHCVGRYGNKHVKQTDCIFFVRRYRRPERSYYTLDINMTEAVPRKVQLHGYMNDMRCVIPQEVRDFVKRWENEILVPTVAKMKKEQAKKPDKKRKENAA